MEGNGYSLREEPQGPLSKLGNEMLEQIPEGSGIKAIICLTDHDSGVTIEGGGIAIHGYADSIDAVMDMLVFLKAMAEAHGMSIGVGMIE